MTSPEHKAELIGEVALQEMLDDPKLRPFFFAAPDGAYTTPPVTEDDVERDLRHGHRG